MPDPHISTICVEPDRTALHAAHFGDLTDTEYQCVYGTTKAAMYDWLIHRTDPDPPPCPITRYRFADPSFSPLLER